MADQWTHCQWYFQLARCDLSRGNRFDDRLSAFDDPSPPPSLLLSLFLFRCPLARCLLDSSRELLSSLPRLHRLVLSFFLPLGERSRSTFLALATSLYVAFQCLRGELYCDCEDRRTSTKQQASRQGSQASVSARGPLRRLTSGQRS